MAVAIRRRDLVLDGMTLGGVVSLIMPRPAGNSTDGQARKLQPTLQKELGATLIVENLPGAGGSLGVRRLLAAAPETTPLLTPTGPNRSSRLTTAFSARSFSWSAMPRFTP